MPNPNPDSDPVIRPASPADAASIHALICELAEYEKMRDEVESTPEMIAEAIGGDAPAAEVLLAEVGGQPVGFALYFHTFSTFVGRRGIYLEDIYVKPEARGSGLGKALLARVAKIAHQRGCGRLDWTVLDWNEPAIQFYERLGAKLLRNWIHTRVDRDGIAKIAAM